MDHAPPSLATFERLAQAAIDTLPPAFRAAAAEVVLLVEDWPPEHILTELEIDDPRDLTGLYEGVPLTGKSQFDQPLGPDTVWIFREPILDEWRDRGNVDLGDLVAHVVVHEFAHHFGWSDDDIAAIDRWWE
ncbi:MAG: metallopeptidase family protein [Roseovarius sp.]|nr:metallopeptidase family protein [Roseovarius sp.]